MNEFEKYTRAIELMNAVPGDVCCPHDPECDSECDLVKANRMETQARWDELYTFIFANFERPSTYHDYDDPDQRVKYDKVAKWADENTETHQYMFDAYAMLRHQQDEMLERLTKVPPGYSDAVFPMAIGRYLMAHKKIRCFPRELTNFTEFANRCGVISGECDGIQQRHGKAV